MTFIVHELINRFAITKLSFYLSFKTNSLEFRNWLFET